MRDSPHKNTQIILHTAPSEDIASRGIQEFFDLYLSTYAAGDSHTARAKQLDTMKFLEFLVRYRKADSADNVKVRDWDPSSTQMFVDRCLELGEAPSTVARRLATLKHLGRTFADKIPGFINPAREIKAPKVQTLKPKSLDSKEVSDILDRSSSRVDDDGSFIARRNDTLVKLLLDTGLRAEEVRTLRRGQVDERCEWIEQARTKGRRFRNVYITSNLRPVVEEYLRARSTELQRFFPQLSPQIDAKLPLFISNYGARVTDLSTFHMSPKSVWRIVRSLTIDTKLHPHLLRHTFATDLLDNSKDIRLVAQALGHSDVRVTMRYTERSNEEVASALEKTRAGKKNNS